MAAVRQPPPQSLEAQVAALQAQVAQVAALQALMAQLPAFQAQVAQIPALQAQMAQFRAELAQVRAEVAANKTDNGWFSKEDFAQFLHLALSFCGFTHYPGPAHEKQA